MRFLNRKSDLNEASNIRVIRQMIVTRKEQISQIFPCHRFTDFWIRPKHILSLYLMCKLLVLLTHYPLKTDGSEETAVEIDDFLTKIPDFPIGIILLSH